MLQDSIVTFTHRDLGLQRDRIVNPLVGYLPQYLCLLLERVLRRNGESCYMA